MTKTDVPLEIIQTALTGCFCPPDDSKQLQLIPQKKMNMLESKTIALKQIFVGLMRHLTSAFKERKLTILLSSKIFSSKHMRFNIDSILVASNTKNTPC